MNATIADALNFIAGNLGSSDEAREAASAMADAAKGRMDSLRDMMRTRHIAMCEQGVRACDVKEALRKQGFKNIIVSEVVIEATKPWGRDHMGVVAHIVHIWQRADHRRFAPVVDFPNDGDGRFPVIDDPVRVFALDEFILPVDKLSVGIALVFCQPQRRHKFFHPRSTAAHGGFAVITFQ